MNLPVPLYGLAIESEKRKTKKGDRFFWQVTIKTVVGNLKCFMWNAGHDAETDPIFPHTGDIIEVTDFEDQLAERGTVVINTFRRLTKDLLPESAKKIMEFEKASDADIKWAFGLISDNSFWADKSHHRLVTACLKSIDIDKLRVCPAATHIHHQYQGGLLVHTAEVLELSRSVVETCFRRYPFINKDVVYASAILHDIGKLETYNITDLGVAESATTEKILGHLFYSMYLVQKVGREIVIDKNFVNEVLHCIAAHHGLPEHGSLKVVQSIEAGILSRVDYISSRNGMVENVLKDSIKSTHPPRESFQIYGDSYFYSEGMRKYVEC